ncbi:hypothetical protein FVE85_4274 [Porphyridium purpureum]|uniref:Uncharacterized protein n=1 Tax=Porphyridium purpureum TaxID=35688 RepID=A0A5J4YSC0_PORPP|nr:hypothetical protein FVE85_4274 [Porphyridium purpureum]|eukprot:POR9310..scf229_5
MDAKPKKEQEMMRIQAALDARWDSSFADVLLPRVQSALLPLDVSRSVLVHGSLLRERMAAPARKLGEAGAPPPGVQQSRAQSENAAAKAPQLAAASSALDGEAARAVSKGGALNASTDSTALAGSDKLSMLRAYATELTRVPCICTPSRAHENASEQASLEHGTWCCMRWNPVAGSGPDAHAVQAPRVLGMTLAQLEGAVRDRVASDPEGVAAHIRTSTAPNPSTAGVESGGKTENASAGAAESTKPVPKRRIASLWGSEESPRNQEILRRKPVAAEPSNSGSWHAAWRNDEEQNPQKRPRTADHGSNPSGNAQHQATGYSSERHALGPGPRPGTGSTHEKEVRTLVKVLRYETDSVKALDLVRALVQRVFAWAAVAESPGKIYAAIARGELVEARSCISKISSAARSASATGKAAESLSTSQGACSTALEVIKHAIFTARAREACLCAEQELAQRGISLDSFLHLKKLVFEDSPA